MRIIDVARFDRGQVRGEAKITDEGYIKANAIVTRTGVLTYKNPDGTIRHELRHPEDVLSTESLESMKMIPVTNGHPEERLVTAENAKRLAIGYTGETVTQDGDFILSNLVITDAEGVKQVTEKNRKELSLGYTVDLIPEEGSYNGQPYNFRQTNIKYNHLSIVDNARAGREARIALDSSDAEEIIREEAVMAKRKVKFDDDEILMEDNAADRVEQLMELCKSLEEKVRALEADRVGLDPEVKEEDSKENPEATRDPQVKAPEGQTVPEKPQQREHMEYEKYQNNNVDSAYIRTLVKERVKLQKIAEAVLDSKTLARVDEMTDLEIKKEVIKSRQQNANLDGKNDLYIQARFDSLLDDMPAVKAQVIAKPVEYSKTKTDQKQVDATDARKAMIDRHKNGYKLGGK